MVDVSIIVLCYKQEDTISRTLDSILNQITNYNFEIIIGDDASPDATRKICEEYVSRFPDLISLNAPHSNYGVVKNYAECLSRVRGRYIMECAGDDWWHNPNKIELQLGYMDTHINCVLCYGGYDTFTPIDYKTEYSSPVHIVGDSFKDVLRNNPICAPTVCIRTSAMQRVDYASFIEEGFLVEDYPTWLSLSLLGDFYCIDNSLATYSIYSGSIQHTSNYQKRLKYLNSYLVMKEYFAKKANRLDELKVLIRNSYYESLAIAAFTYGYRKDALFAYSKIENKSLKIWLKVVICLFPFSFKYYSKRFAKGL